MIDKWIDRIMVWIDGEHTSFQVRLQKEITVLLKFSKVLPLTRLI